MSKISALFFDVGGVCLTNGWDEESRGRAVKYFHLDGEEMESRHRLFFEKLDRGEMPLDDYLAKVIFFEKRPFSKEKFIRFMEGESKPYETTLKALRWLKEENRYLLAALNNESLELNRFRIEKFGLRDYFTAFFSSCYLGARKPEARIYEIALEVTQRKPGECLFIDDRQENVKAAQALGMRAIHLKNVEKLTAELLRFH